MHSGRILRAIAIGFTCVLVPYPALGKRLSLSPFCNNLGLLVSTHEVAKIEAEDIERRQLLILQALGVQGMQAIEKAIHGPPFRRVQSREEALAIAHMAATDASVTGALNQILGKMSPSNRWALYLNSGFHAISTYTDPHREMVLRALEHFPFIGEQPNKTRVLDVGIGNGNLIIAAMVQNPKGVVDGLDVAGAGINIATLRMNEIADRLQLGMGKKNQECVGRFCMARASATDPEFFAPNRYHAASMVLTNFAIPTERRDTSLKNVFNSLRPGGYFVFIDPIPRANDGAMGMQFINQAVENAFQNNTDITALDIALFSANNSQNLLKIKFLSPQEQTSLVERAGFKAVAPSDPVFFGFANMQVFQKPGP